MKVVLVTGSRDWTDDVLLGQVLDDAAPDLVIEGGARGADQMARTWCLRSQVHYAEMPALWGTGKKAGAVRNDMMIAVACAMRDAGHDVTVLAFPLPSSKGTIHCMSRAAKERLPIIDRTGFEVVESRTR